MSEQKPHIRDAEIDEILEQVQQQRGDTRPVQGTDAELDAILAELGIAPTQKRVAAEPVLLPKPTFSRPARQAAGQQAAAGQQTAAGQQMSAGQQAATGRQTVNDQQTAAGQQSAAGRQPAAGRQAAAGQQTLPAGRTAPVGQAVPTPKAPRAPQTISARQAVPAGQAALPGQPPSPAQAVPAGQPTPAGQAAFAPQAAQNAAAIPVQGTAPAPAPATAAAPAADPQSEKTTVELPSIKAYTQAEARKQAEARARLLEQARREAEQKLQSKAQTPQPGPERRAQPGAAKQPLPAQTPGGRTRAENAAARPENTVHSENDAPQQENTSTRTRNTSAQESAPAAGRAPEQAPAIAGNNLFGGVDDQFIKFFQSQIIDDPRLKDPEQRKKEKGGLWAKLFSKRYDDEEDAADQEQGGTGAYYEAAQEDGFSEAFEAIRNGQSAGDPQQQPDADASGTARTAVWTDSGTPLSASIVARAITGTDSFAFGGTRSQHGFSVDVDLPLSGDGTGEYEKPRGSGDSLSPEEDLEEYSNLSDAPVVAGELSAMRQTRMVRTVFTGALALFLVYLGLSSRTGWLPPIAVLDPHTAPLAYIVTNFALLAVAAFSSITTIGSGLRGLVRRPTADSFAALATVAAAVQNAAYLWGAKSFDPETVTLFTPVAALLLCGNALGKWMQMRAVCANFALASSGEEHAAAFLLQKEQLARRLCDGFGEPEPRLLLSRPTALVKGFLSQSFSARPLDDSAQKLCWALCGVALLCAGVAGAKNGVNAALSGFAAAMALGSPLAATVAYALPAKLLQSSAARCGAVVPGPSAVRALGSANTVLLRARDLFPAGSVRLHGIKTFEKERIDLAILYAASILSVQCETLRGVFMGMLDNNEKLLCKVENATTEIGCGFIGWINGTRVLLGNREMMRRHDIEVPSLDYENRYTKNGQRSPIYLAVSGKLFGMFLVSYRPSRRAAEALSRLADSGRGVLIQAEDFNITAPLVTEVYGLPEGIVKVLSQPEWDALENELTYHPESEGVMIHNGTCASLLGGMYAAARTAAGERLAGIVLVCAAALGMATSVAISFSQGLAGLGLGIVLAYQLIWSVAIAAAPLLKKP